MTDRIYSEFQLGDMAVLYCRLGDTLSLVLAPQEKRAEIEIDSLAQNDPMIQVCVLGDKRFRQYSRGMSMRNAAGAFEMKPVSQQIRKQDSVAEIITFFQRENGQSCAHHLRWDGVHPVLECWNVFQNDCAEEITLEMLSSFSLSGVSPFPAQEAGRALELHRIRSRWSAEGRLDTKRVEELMLEEAWVNYGQRTERFGQTGSMPVRGFFPFAALEDKDHGVIWAASLETPASWQMEVGRYNDKLSLTGGLADFEFGHWRKVLKPGEAVKTPAAFLTVMSGTIDDACNRLVAFYASRTPSHPGEEELPVVFNEYCNTWGKPTIQKIREMTAALKGSGVRYFVIDAGWYCSEGRDWSIIGDWNTSAERFPGGMREAAKVIRDADMIPGIWFEPEGASEGAALYQAKGKDLSAGRPFFLTRDKRLIQNEDRVFLNFRNPLVQEYLNEKVIGFLKENGFGYMKVDYNDAVGIGCDGAESYGEGLRQHSEAVCAFYRRLKEELPELVLEMCASGGHRLEPGTLSVGHMSSFSDAHECAEGAIVAANLHRVVPPRQSQIWAVIHKQDSAKEIVFTLAKSFLGRMCLSGDICDLSEQQWALVKKSIRFCHKIRDVIKDGNSFRYGPEVMAYRHPEGWQAVLRVGAAGQSAVLVVHTFGGTLPASIAIRNDALRGMAVSDSFSEEVPRVAAEGDTLRLSLAGNFSACAVYLEKTGNEDRA